MKSPHPNLLRALLGLFVLASFSYWAAGVRDTWNIELHTQQHVATPFTYDNSTGRITSVRPEARQAGMAAGGRIAGLNGAPYTGVAQWSNIVNTARPGDSMLVTFVRSNGTTGTGVITFAAHAPLHVGVAEWESLLSLSLLVGLLPLMCLLIGYWIVLAKPTDANAWLLLILFTLPSVVVLNPGLAAGSTLAPRLLWFNAIQLLALPALLLFGMYFPERSRIDRRAPWIKGAILIPYFAAAALLYAQTCRDYFVGTSEGKWLAVSGAAGAALSVLLLVCGAMYLVFTLDKLWSASTADARRRLRVLTAGTGIGLSALLAAVLLHRFNVLQGSTATGYWINVTCAVLFMAAPFTLAYVALVQRAMDVRMILRMGTRYVLAKTFLASAQAILVVAGVLLLVVPALHGGHPELSTQVTGWVLLAAAAALRLGVQKRTQQWIDRRFFRETYNAELVLNELANEVRRFTETAPLLETVAHRVSETLHVDQIAVLLRRQGAFHLEHAVGVAANGSLALTAHDSSVRYLGTTNEPARLYRDDPDAWYLMAGLSERRTLDLVNAELLLPLPGRNRLAGIMTLGPKRSEAAYTAADVHMLQTLATQTGLALEVAELAHSLAAEAAQRERVNREIEIAREVQERLFPQQMPEIPGATIAGHCRPALGVGGDYYDVFPLEDGRVGLAIGDVSGKGIAAALLMASLRASLRGVSLNHRHDFAGLMDKINRLVYEASAENRYATFFFAAYDPKTRRLDCVNAGHNPPVVVRGANGTAEALRLEADGPVLGLLPYAVYTEQSHTLAPGDMLLLYTDGVSEAMTHADEEWGEERMIASAHGHGSKPASAVLKHLFSKADDFTAGAPQHDDMTALVLKLEE